MNARMYFTYFEIVLQPESYGIVLFQKKDDPDSNWVILKSDGSVRFDDGFAAAGRFLSDHNDGWIIGYCRYLGNCTVVEAELWGILDGLNLILNRSLEKVVIQTDSIEAVNAIQEDIQGYLILLLSEESLIFLKLLISGRFNIFLVKKIQSQTVWPNQFILEDLGYD
ncbi:hypothetical protein PVK06_044806 [Gossypium arboreum]|uniref:RNase H type-1 domain-containing protein n=1 Tax=Gossypium arboreum TaxID=29729 RepID=A0ABR0MS82_GOSAR|nr:hypothetical protein PVK06_044806 [Gossypium arboreum]